MRDNLKALWPFLRPYRNKLWQGLATIIASVVIGLLNPLLIGHGIDAVRAGAGMGTLAVFAVAMIGVTIVAGLFNYLQRMILVAMSRDVEFDLRNRYFERLELLPQSFFQSHPTGDLMARATNDLQAVRMLCGPAIMYSTNTVLLAVGAIALMARIHLGLTGVALAIMPLVAIATQMFGDRIHRLFEGVQERFSALSAKAQENLSGVRVVRAYAQEEREIDAFGSANASYVEGNRRLIIWQAAFFPALQGLAGIAMVAVLYFGGKLAISGRITVGEFVTFNTLLARMVWPMIALGWVINLVQRGTASLGRMRAVLEAEPTIKDEPPFAEPARFAGEVRFRGLSFSYRPGLPPALHDISLDVGAGTTVAIVGRTGSGKSTLLSLLPRLLDPPPGTLFVDGADLRHLPLERLRAEIGIVPQETFLFSATLSENIALGRPDASEAEILEAAEMAGLGPDLADFPAGLETRVGERGLTLSGGQKQRVAIARALLRQPRILLLDDCLSAVDTHTEERILGNLRRFFPGRTVFLVSHRVSAVQGADLIVVLDQGRIAERGTHDQLLAHGGLYAELAERQQLEEELAAV
ncbi:MAG TPA: ABC transporter ATP-binding protein [Thermoanaerobaculia bacterium]|nr:ABC transporter ATP-binding protein [Thermoanaerobaculia bacterium]